ncbi:MAG: hypothetical protein J6A59_01190 [Lachnospiraceae bacterium]|nr:hypothetical protein [Lachnospiraceae bacterium]
MKTRHRELVETSIIFVVLTLCNLWFNEKIDNTALFILNSVLESLINTLVLYGYVLIVDKPIYGLLVILTSKLISVLYDLINAKLEVSSFGSMGLLLVAGILIQMTIISNQLKLSKEKVSIINKFKKIITIERTAFKVKWWAKLIVYCSMITMIMTLTNSDMLDIMSKDMGFRLYSSIAITLPLLTLIGIITTSDFTYELFGFQLFMEMFTIYNLTKLGKIPFDSIIFIVAELVAFIYAVDKVVTIRNKTGEKTENVNEQ